MKAATIVYPHQLFEHHPALNKERPIYLVEDPHFFTRYQFHRQKLAYHKATMFEYLAHLTKHSYNVHYVELNEDISTQLGQDDITELHCCLVYDQVLEASLEETCREHKVHLIWYESPYFMTSREQFEAYFAQKKKKYYFTTFYHAQRTTLDILMVDDKPAGGTFSYDPENRLKIPPGVTVPPVPEVSVRPSIKKAQVWTEQFDHYGSVDNWYYPVTFTSAKLWLNTFLKERLKEYGPYQDALQSDASMLFHSILSPMINVGLLTPDYVVKKTVEYAHEHHIPLNSLEGFIRQIIGWREYVYGIYAYRGNDQQQSNFFKHSNKLPATMWTGTTGIEPIDLTIRRILDTAYGNHIERLMVLGNFMLMCEIDPREVYRWFMELFIDAYDWVMIPNVYGMSQFADGGLMVTKPYFSSANYLKNMSNYPNGTWNNVFDALCWRFMAKNEKQFSQIPRMRFMNSVLHKMNPHTIKHHTAYANKFLDSFLAGETWT